MGLCGVRVTLVLTHDCNLRCDYCYTGEKSDRPMADQVAWKALQLAFRQARPDQLSYVSFFGGEPLLHFDKIVRWTRLIWKWRRLNNFPVALQMTTNATILNESILQFLSHYRFQVGFSVDGLGDHHDRHRPFTSGRPSSQVVWRNLERAAGHLPQATIQMVLNPDTVHGIPQAMVELRRLGYTRFTLLPNMQANWSTTPREVLEAVYQAWRQDAQLLPFTSQASSAESRSCGFGSSEIAVAPGGALYPCARLVGTDQRQSIQCGHVAVGLNREKLTQIGERARVKEAAVGISGGCGCISFMPGNLLHQLQNVRYFADLEQVAHG